MSYSKKSEKRKKNKTSNYQINACSTFDEMSRSVPHYIGKVRSNFMGTEFTIYSTGIHDNNNNETHQQQEEKEEAASPQYILGKGDKIEIGGVFYTNTLFTNNPRGPRQMHVVLPNIDYPLLKDNNDKRN
ncbi:hypothetical protein Pmar_PMAR008213, partial [Perkinsus marinus ATCC 50983]